MRVLTQEIVDVVAPKHDRTSCTDADLANSYGGWSGRYSEKTGKKVFDFPRCTRCYLLYHLHEDVSKLDFKIEVTLVANTGD